MLSHVKMKYTMAQHPSRYYAFTIDTNKRRVQSEHVFTSMPPPHPVKFRFEYVQPGRKDIRVFNFTTLSLVQVHLNGVRTPLEIVHLRHYKAPRQKQRYRYDVQALIDMFGYEALEGRVIIAERLTLHASSETDAVEIVNNMTIAPALKQSIFEGGTKRASIGDKNYCVVDGMFLTFIKEEDLKSYTSAMDAHTGIFVSREDLFICQPHPYDHDPSMVQAVDYNDDVSKAALCSYRYVYHDDLPQQVYVNIAGVVVTMPMIHDTSQAPGVHYTVSIPPKHSKVAGLVSHYIPVKDITERNGFYLTEKAAAVQLRQGQIDRLLDFQDGINTSVRENGKHLEKAVSEMLTKSFGGLETVLKKEKDRVALAIDAATKQLEKEVDAFRVRNEAFSAAMFNTKAEHERKLQAHRETQELVRLIPVFTTFTISMLSMLSKKKR